MKGEITGKKVNNASLYNSIDYCTTLASHVPFVFTF